MAYGCLFLLRSPLARFSSWMPATSAADTIWLTVLSFEALLFTIAIAYWNDIQIELIRQENEARLAAAAELADLAFYEVDFTAGVAFFDERLRALLGLPHEHWAALGVLANCAWSVLQENVSGHGPGWRLQEYNAGSLPVTALADDR